MVLIASVTQQGLLDFCFVFSLIFDAARHTGGARGPEIYVLSGDGLLHHLGRRQYDNTLLDSSTPRKRYDTQLPGIYSQSGTNFPMTFMVV